MRKVSVVAHRGASGEYPENTEAAYQAAIHLGVEIIEIDVHMTRDGTMVILHDYTVDRTSDGCGAVAEMSLSEIKDLDAGGWFDPSFAGQRFLTLAETLDLMPAGMKLNVHVKETDADREILVPMVVAELQRRSLIGDAFVTGEKEVVRLARKTVPQVEICCFLTVPECVDLQCMILQPGNRIVTTELVEDAHRHGIEVNPFFADDTDEMLRLIDCGVDGILTNYPARLQDLSAGS